MRLACAKNLDLIVLDVMLPNLSGLDVCKQLRRQGNTLPIIMLTARGQEIDKVLGLKIGADDYVTKPFSFMELMARVEALLRRTKKQQTPLEVYRFGNVTLDFKKFEACKQGRMIELSPREFKSSSTSSSTEARWSHAISFWIRYGATRTSRSRER